MVFGYGSLLGFRIATNQRSALGAAGLMFVFGFAVGWIWVLHGLYVKSPQSLQGFGFIVMFPLAFGSNVFIQASTLPGWLQAWVGVNPVTALAGSSRGLMLGGPVAIPARHSIACRRPAGLREDAELGLPAPSRGLTGPTKSTASPHPLILTFRHAGSAQEAGDSSGGHVRRDSSIELIRPTSLPSGSATIA
jgi:hypothetical protein